MSNLSNLREQLLRQRLSSGGETPLLKMPERTNPTANGYKPPQKTSFVFGGSSETAVPPASYADLPIGAGNMPIQFRDYASKVQLPAEPKQHDDSSSEEEEEERTSRYKISNLITLFNKTNIELVSIFTYKKRVSLIQVTHESFNYFIYIPSKYEMYIDRSLGIATYDLKDDDEEEENENQDTLFYSKLPIQNLRREKKSKCKNLTRFLPLVSESPIKIVYIEEYFLCYINRYNEIDSMILLSPFKSSGYFYLTDLEFFFKNLPKLVEEFSKFEKALTEAVYDKLTVEVDAAKQAVAKAQKIVSGLDPKGEKKNFAKKIVKLNEYYKDDKHRAKAKDMLVNLRSKNLKKMFEIENLTYVMKEFK